MRTVWSYRNAREVLSVTMTYAAFFFLAKYNISQVRQARYSADLAPWNFFLFKNEISLERNMIWRQRGNSEEQDEAAARYFQKGVSELLSSMETTMNKLCSLRRRLLGRTLNAELVCIIVFFLFSIALVPIPFDQNSYNKS